MIKTPSTPLILCCFTWLNTEYCIRSILLTRSSTSSSFEATVRCYIGLQQSTWLCAWARHIYLRMSQTYIKDTALYKGHSPHQDRCVSQKISCEGVGRRPISFGQTNWHTQMWLKQWMQYELFLENLVLVDLKRVGPPWALRWHGRDQHDQRIFWCLFGVYYWRAPERGEGIRETKEKFIKFKSNSYLRASPLLTET